MENAEKRIAEIIRILKNEYPGSETALRFRTPLQILVATILSAQCTDTKVNEITSALFDKYPDAEAFARAEQSDLEQEIRPTGFFRNKAKSIVNAAKKIVKDFGGEVPETMENLLQLPGVARKTANIVLSSAFQKVEGIAVDTHVKRLSGRLGLSCEREPDKIERDLIRIVPKSEWIHFNDMLVDHGRQVCQAKKPNCPECKIRHLCPSARHYFPNL